MDQEYTKKDSDIKLKKIDNCKFLLAHIVLLIVSICAILLMLAIISFHPSYFSWLQITRDGFIKNLVSSFGAWSADILFSTFGISSYIIPLLILVGCWNTYKDINYNRYSYLSFFNIFLRFIEGSTLIITSSAIARLNINDLPNLSSGGIVGSVFSGIILSWFNIVGTKLTLLCIWVISFTLFTRWCSWLIIIKKVSALVLSIVVSITNYFSNRENNNKNQAIEDHVLSNLTKLSGSALNMMNHTDSDRVFFSAPRIKGCIKNRLTNNNNQFCQSGMSGPLTSTKIGVIFNIETKSLKSNKNTFDKSLNPKIIADNEINLNIRPIDLNHTIHHQANEQKEVSIKLTNLLITSATEVDLRVNSYTTFMPVKLQIKKGISSEFSSVNPVCLQTQQKFCGNFSILQKEYESDANLKANQNPIIQQYISKFDDDKSNKNKLYERSLQHKNVSIDINQTKKLNQLTNNIPTNDKFITSNEKKINKLVNIGCRRSMEEKKVIPQKQIVENSRQRLTFERKKQKIKQMLFKQRNFLSPFLTSNNQVSTKPTALFMLSLDLLAKSPNQNEPINIFMLQQTSRLIESRLNDYNIKAEVVGVSSGPVITRFELDLAPGVRVARVSNLSRDLARSLSVATVRIVDVIPGKPYIGLELPNEKRKTVYLRDVIDSDKFRLSSSLLTLVLGKDIEGEPVIADLKKMPHLLVAGTTGSGKSVGINAIILSILYKANPDEVRFIMIDPKMLELSIYDGIPHLLTEVITDMKDAINVLRWCVNEMDRRYKLMSTLGVRNLANYNDKINIIEGNMDYSGFNLSLKSITNNTCSIFKKEPYIVVIIDEFADLIMTTSKKVEELIIRLAQKARAAGIHLVLATQRPSVDIITGLIKANIPTRIAFTVSSKIDSRTIIDQSGAESLLGMGDMLYLPPNSSIPIRVHGAFVRDEEVHNVVKYWQARSKPKYITDSAISDSENNNGSNGCDSNEELDT